MLRDTVPVRIAGVVVIHNERLRDNTYNVPDSVCKKCVLWIVGVKE